MKLIFLDIDGVLNAHEKLPSGYRGIGRAQADQFNRILESVPDAKIVISSAWRYLVLNGSMTIKGLQYLLLTHGVHCENRIHGHTTWDGARPDDPNNREAWAKSGLLWRKEQIGQYVIEHSPTAFVVLDDLPIDVPNLVLTDADIGLTSADADRAIAILRGAGS